MSVGLADLYTAIAAAWNASGLDAMFLALRDSSVVDANFPVLHDQEASPNQPHPYCVMDQISTGTTTTRMSSGVNGIRVIRDVPVKFNIYAKEVSGDSRTAKAIAAYLAEELMKVFGGHPTESPSGSVTLSNGNHLITQYQNDYCMRIDDDEYQWTVYYNFKLDVPVAV